MHYFHLCSILLYSMKVFSIVWACTYYLVIRVGDSQLSPISKYITIYFRCCLWIIQTVIWHWVHNVISTLITMLYYDYSMFLSFWSNLHYYYNHNTSIDMKHMCSSIVICRELASLTNRIPSWHILHWSAILISWRSHLNKTEDLENIDIGNSQAFVQGVSYVYSLCVCLCFSLFCIVWKAVSLSCRSGFFRP